MHSEPSAVLIEAQAKLNKLKTAAGAALTSHHGRTREGGRRQLWPGADPPGASNRQASAPGQNGRTWTVANAQKAIEAARRRASLDPKTPHTAVNPDSAIDWSELAEQARIALETAHTAEHGRNRPKPDQAAGQGVKTYPSLSLAALKGGHAAVYRVWLLARHFDEDGRGWVDFEDFKTAITAEHSPHRAFTTRQRAGQILREGRGVFWTLETGRDGRKRLRYTGAAQLAAELQAERLTGDPVDLDLKTITANIGRFKAALYASFHAGRAAEDGEGAPISRAVQENLTGHSARTLQRYDRRANVRRRSNFALHGRCTAEKVQDIAWDHGRAVFEFTDHEGRQGRPGGVYVARRLPNSYRVNMPTGSRGRQKKINNDLCHPRDNGARGAGLVQIFHNTAVAAARAFNRDSDTGRLWPILTRPAGRFWGEIAM